MSRRRVQRAANGFPPKLASFDVNDWWVRDPDDELEERYARIRWSCARRAFEDGDDWEAHMQPPEWWTPLDPDPQTRGRAERVHDPDP